jgi:SpoIID/LytB domain protein
MKKTDTTINSPLGDRGQPTISVGILSAKHIHFILNGNYRFEEKTYTRELSVSFENGKMRLGENLYTEILFLPEEYSIASFDLKDVVIGIGFHWERKETQRFKGSLKLIVENEQLTAINLIPIEDYLTSVISSEMSATSSLELLKAHAVISRSWLLKQPPNFSPRGRKTVGSPEGGLLNSSLSGSANNYREGGAVIRWYERDAHTNFNVCADDHCQRYQGITRANTEAVKNVIEATHGQVLMHEGKICDTRFSKCCGGITELFENCWEPQHHDYLIPVEDKPKGGVINEVMSETEMEDFIKNPLAGNFCNTSDTKVLSQVLNSYDQETPDFYRWEVRYTQMEIAELLSRRSGIDFGEIVDFVPVERGISGRLIQLKIIGTKQTVIIGKELEIRKWLSNSHLYSSAFIIEKSDIKNNIPQTFTLLGAGWGHGVGLCQIGAAVMAEKGYLYQDILKHYFRNTELKTIY